MQFTTLTLLFLSSLALATPQGEHGPKPNGGCPSPEPGHPDWHCPRPNFRGRHRPGPTATGTATGIFPTATGPAPTGGVPLPTGTGRPVCYTTLINEGPGVQKREEILPCYPAPAEGQNGDGDGEGVAYTWPKLKRAEGVAAAAAAVEDKAS